MSICNLDFFSLLLYNDVKMKAGEKMATDKKPTMLRLPRDILEKTKIIAEKEHRSMNMQIEYALMVYIAAYEKEHGVIPLPNLSEEE